MFMHWCVETDNVLAAALAGSWARHAARADSDIDIVILAAKPGALLRNRQWLSRFGSVEWARREDWGQVQSLRVRYRTGGEVEFGVAELLWAATDPLDPGTLRVVSDGFHVLHDPQGLLEKLKMAVLRPPTEPTVL